MGHEVTLPPLVGNYWLSSDQPPTPTRTISESEGSSPIVPAAMDLGTPPCSKRDAPTADDALHLRSWASAILALDVPAEVNVPRAHR